MFQMAVGVQQDCIIFFQTSDRTFSCVLDEVLQKKTFSEKYAVLI